VLRLTGTTSAGNFANITMPMLRGPDSGRNLTLIKLAKSGSMVKKGDVVAQVDGQSLQDHIDDVQATVDSAEADIRKTKAEQAIELETLRQTLRVAKATLDKIKLDSQALEVRTVIDQEQIKLSLEEAQAQYNELQKDFQTVIQRQKSELRLKELARDKNLRHKMRHVSDLERFTIHTPMDGLVVMQSVWRGGDMGQVQLGDQVSPGQPFMKIVDPGSMLMNAVVNQAESESIRIGQTANIVFDAFPGLTEKGRVFAVGALASGGWRSNYYIRSIPVRISLLGQDPRVIPDLSAAADVVIGTESNTLMIPLEAVHEVAGKIVVYVKHAGGFVAREVKLGGRNNVQVAVASGLQAGDEVALQPPASGVVAR
jgi:multidrug efflux pump subunit AcrA (membrane-fusion protein)